MSHDHSPPTTPEPRIQPRAKGALATLLDSTLLRYFVIGAVASGVFYGVANLSAHILAGLVALEARTLTESIATLLGSIASFVFGYFAQMRLAFRAAPQHSTMLPRYCALLALIAIYAQVLTYLGVFFDSFLGAFFTRSYYWVSAFIALSVPLFSYPLQKYWVFGGASTHTSAQTSTLDSAHTSAETSKGGGQHDLARIWLALHARFWEFFGLRLPQASFRRPCGLCSQGQDLRGALPSRAGSKKARFCFHRPRFSLFRFCYFQFSFFTRSSFALSCLRFWGWRFCTPVFFLTKFCLTRFCFSKIGFCIFPSPYFPHPYFPCSHSLDLRERLHTHIPQHPLSIPFLRSLYVSLHPAYCLFRLAQCHRPAPAQKGHDQPRRARA